MMHDCLVQMLLHGPVDGPPWGGGERVRFVCPVPGYDRHFTMLASYGIEMLTVPMREDGPDAAAVEALERLNGPLAALARRLEAVVEDAPDWLDSQARARVEGAINGISWRREALSAWIALLARIGGEADPAFVDWLAVERAGNRVTGSVAASDAFFPFADGPQVLLDAGVAAIVQPGGSVRDAEVVAAVEASGATMYFTGARHFFH